MFKTLHTSLVKCGKKGMFIKTFLVDCAIFFKMKQWLKMSCVKSILGDLFRS